MIGRLKKHSSISRMKISLLILLLIGFALVAAGCVGKSGTLIGEEKTLGNGKVRSWATFDNDGKPSAIGVTFSESALSGLPGESTTEYILALPEKASTTAFNHIGLGWDAKGHPPLGIYETPHFDVFFYILSPQARQYITATGLDRANVEKKPEPEYIPAGYLPLPGGVPTQGAHWVDPYSPEFNRQPFTRTFIYGFYNGRMVFMGPMVTKDFLETKTNTTDAIKLPERFLRLSYYPTRYSVTYDAVAREYTISLEGMALR
ncbi:Uncharacterised protein [uncultured archaeon]|nr:Uncharacterised protein [uncultured archaeon]